MYPIERNETRADTALRIGELVLEAIDDAPNAETSVLLPLDGESFQLMRDIVVGVHPLLIETEESA